jgi:hypothetical protein
MILSGKSRFARGARIRPYGLRLNHGGQLYFDEFFGHDRNNFPMAAKTSGSLDLWNVPMRFTPWYVSENETRPPASSDDRQFPVLVLARML